MFLICNIPVILNCRIEITFIICMISKEVLIINQYSSTLEYGFGGRHYYLSKELVKLGFKVTLIMSANHHFLRSRPHLTSVFHCEESEGVKFVWVRTLPYIKVNGIRRILGWFDFGLKIQWVAYMIASKPDVVIYSTPSLVPGIFALKLAKKNSAKFILDIRDVWPLTLINMKRYSSYNIFIGYLGYIEKKLYTECDAIVSNIQDVMGHVESVIGYRKKSLWIPNGVSLDEMNESIQNHGIDLSQYNDSDFIVAYIGTIGASNDISTLLKAAKHLLSHKEIKFMIVGDGADLDNMKNYVKQNELNNVYFYSSIPKRSVQSVMSRVNALYFGCLPLEIYKYGIAANKIPEILYSGKPIISSYSGNFAPVDEFDVGINVSSRDSVALASGILQIMDYSPTRLSQISVNGKNAVRKYYDYKIVTRNLSSFIKEVLHGK